MLCVAPDQLTEKVVQMLPAKYNTACRLLFTIEKGWATRDSARTTQ